MESSEFEIAFVYEGKSFKGQVYPSVRILEGGQPATFKLILNSISFGLLTFYDCKWSATEPAPEELVSAAGREIEKHFKL